MREVLGRFLADESGNALTEYTLIVALIAVGLVGVMVAMRNSMGATLSHAKTTLDNAEPIGYAP
ncbi:MAG TPA: Flp family type IVb pilin [Longimicrobiales bacterium]|nr:Flp family type IVb pilin [Longimicrobiales bacterium]